MKLPKIFHSKLFLAAVCIVLMAVFGLELQQWQQRRKIDSEISHLQEEQAELEQRNKALQESLEYFSSDSYQEKLAREQLGLKKEGEVVVNFPAGGIIPQDHEPEPDHRNNLQKWWEYIFRQS